MSGHSHFKTILHKKQITDAKRSKIFSKMARLISIAAKEGGKNIESNPKLKMAIEQAKSFNLPKDNIERAIKRGVGKLEGEKLEEVVFEAYGPGKIAIIIEGITNNKNRTLAEIKQILSQHNGKLADEGSVKWLFKRKGVITINFQFSIFQPTADQPQVGNFQKKEDLELIVIEAEAEDIYWHDKFLNVYTKPEDLEKVKKNLEKKQIKINSTSLDWVAKEMIEVEKKDEETCQKLFEQLDGNDAVQDIYSNLKT